MSLGVTMREAEQHTLLDLDDLRAYWADHPPVHTLVASYLGIKPKGPKTKASPEKLRELAAAFGMPVKEK